MYNKLYFHHNYAMSFMFSGPFDYRQHDVHVACMYVAWCFQDRLIIGNMTCTWLVCMWHDVFRTVWLSATWRAPGLYVCGMMFSGPFDYRQHDVHVACMYVARRPISTTVARWRRRYWPLRLLRPGGTVVAVPGNYLDHNFLQGRCHVLHHCEIIFAGSLGELIDVYL